MAMSAEHRSKFAALLRQWWRLQMIEKFSSGTKIPKQTKKQNLYFPVNLIFVLILFFLSLEEYLLFTWLVKYLFLTQWCSLPTTLY